MTNTIAVLKIDNSGKTCKHTENNLSLFDNFKAPSVM